MEEETEDEGNRICGEEHEGTDVEDEGHTERERKRGKPGEKNAEGWGRRRRQIYEK